MKTTLIQLKNYQRLLVSILIPLLSLATAQAQDDGAVNDSLLRVLELEEVEVTAQKPIVKMTTDKITYDVSQDADSRSQTLLDMLRKVPMVTVDGQDNIQINGSSSFKVYVDGKPNPMFSSNPSQIFKAVPATMVKEIEVITNPGAKYDAEGAAGILNIKLNHQGAAAGEPEVNGVNGNVNVAGGNKGYGGSAYLGGQFSRFSFSANGSMQRQILNSAQMHTLQEQLSANPSRVETTATGAKSRIPFTWTNLQMGYELDSMSTVNATIGYNSFQMKNAGQTVTSMTGGIYGDGFGYNMFTDMRQKRHSLNLTADYQRFLNAARTSSITLTYLFGRNPSANTNSQLYDHSVSLPAGFEAFLNDRYSDSRDKATEHTAQLDYTTPLTKNHTLNAGAKFTSLLSHSDAEYFSGQKLLLQPDLCSEYKNKKQILASYAEHEGKYGKFSSRLGVRYEHTFQSVEYLLGNGGNYRTDYGNFIPSASLSYSPMMLANIGLTYNLRISRPGLSFLNPYVDRTNNAALTYGNPDLDVEKSHNVGLVANFFTPTIMANVNLRYAYTPNGIEQYSFTRDNLLHTTYGNIVSRNITSASLFASWLVVKNTRIMANLSATYSDLRSDELSRKTHGWSSSIMAGVQQTLPWKMNASLFFISQSKNITLQGNSGGMDIITANLSKTVLKERLTFALQGICGLAEGCRIHIRQESQSQDFRNSTDISIPMAAIQMTITYKFGNQKVRIREHKSKVSSNIIEQRSSMEQIGNIGQ